MATFVSEWQGMLNTGNISSKAFNNISNILDFKLLLFIVAESFEGFYNIWSHLIFKPSLSKWWEHF